MKEDNISIVAIVGLAMTLGFLGFLIYLLRKDPEPITYIVQGTPTEPVYVKQSGVVETEEVRPTKPHIVNHYLSSANQWYEIQLPIDTVTWQLKTRGNYDLLYSFEPTHSTYMTLVRGSVLTENTAPNMSIKSIYVMCETAGIDVELELWRNHD